MHTRLGYVDQAHGSTCLAASVGTRAWATFVKRTNRNLLSGPSSLGAAECRRFPVRLGTSSSHLRPHALPPLPYHRPSESSPSVLSGSRGWHRAAPPILLGPTAASISHHHHHAQMLTLQPHPPDRPQHPATSPRIIYAALTRYGPPVPSMSSATAAQRAHAALLVPGGHGMAAADVLRTGEKIPENPGNDVVCHRS